MQTTMVAFRRELTKMILARKELLVSNLSSGLAITTFEQYREHVGRLAELTEVIEMMDEAEESVNKR